MGENWRIFNGKGAEPKFLNASRLKSMLHGYHYSNYSIFDPAHLLHGIL